MRIFITGVAGSLGTHLAKELVNMGFEVAGNDIKRLEETELFDLPITYIWKSSIDLEPEDLPWIPDVVIDAAIEFADRPLANSSPITTVFGNLATAVRILELARKHFPNALLIYPSSFNSIYGWQYIGWARAQEVLNKTGMLLPLPTSVYGWSKASAELLYFSYAIMHKLRVLITRIGSSYGPGGRCYDEKTEILTNEGWKKFSELRGDELVYTLNPETMEIVLQPIKRMYVYDYDGEMYHIHNSFIDLMVTPNHKMFFAPYGGKPRREPIEEMLKYSYVRLFNTGKWKGERKEKICFTQKLKVCKVCGYVGKYFGAKEPRCSKCKSRRVEIVEKEICYPMDDFLKFLGFWIGDGSLGKRKSSEIVITQIKENTRREILELCKNLFKDSTITIKKNQIIIHNRWVYEWLEKNVGRNKMERRIPNEIKSLSPEQLQILLEWLAKADGTDYGSKFNIYTSNPKLRDDIMEIALKAGFSARYYIRPVGLSSRLKEGRVIVQKHDNYEINITKKVGNNPVLEIRKILNKEYHYTGKRTFVEVVHYKGKVYDVEVPEHHLIYVRRDGKPIWSSNSDELPHKLIVYSIRGLRFKLRSPRATRLWTYVKDAVDFYRELFNEHVYDYEPASPAIITNAGNAGYMDSSKPNYVTTNEEVAQLIKRIAREFGRDLDYEPIDYYEPGEYTPVSMYLDYVDKPIKIDIDVTSMQPTWWKPKYTLYDGLKETYNYFLTIFSRSGERGKQ